MAVSERVFMLRLVCRRVSGADEGMAEGFAESGRHHRLGVVALVIVVDVKERGYVSDELDW